MAFAVPITSAELLQLSQWAIISDDCLEKIRFFNVYSGAALIAPVEDVSMPIAEHASVAWMLKCNSDL